MVATLELVVWVAMLLVGVAFTAVGVDTHRSERFPGSTSFAVYCGALATAFFALAGFRIVDVVQSAAASPGLALALLGVALLLATFVAGLLAPLAWLRFVLAYTGQPVSTTRQPLLLAGLPVVVTVAALLLQYGLPLAFLLLRLGPLPLKELLFGSVTYLVTVTAFYLGSLLVAGGALVAWTSYTNRHLSTRGGTYLAVGCVLPWLATVIPFIAALFTPIFQRAHAAAGGLLGAAVVLAAVRRHDVFARVPAAGTIGRDVTVEATNDPVVVVDDAHRVVDLNPAAERLFDASTDDVGGPLAALVSDAVDPERLLTADATEFELDGGTRVLEARGSELRDEYDRLLGHSLLFHDVTDRERRQQRLQVLNRVLRHNVRNDVAVVTGYAEALAEMPHDLQGYPEAIKETADGLAAIGEKARDVEAVVAAHHDATTPLSSVVRDTVDDVAAEFPDCRFAVDGADVEVAAAEAVLGPVVRELLENGAEHNDADDPRVEVAVADAGDGAVELTVADNGPGIPDHELAPIREGGETDLEHGSGLGLWLVEWGVSAVDGRVAFDRSDDGWTVVTVRLPAAADP